MKVADLTMTELVRMNSRPRKAKPEPCHCPAYIFPHRVNSGQCMGRHQYWCEACQNPCEAVRLRDSFPFEFWGQKGIHDEYYTVSDCCGGDLITGEK